MLLCIHQAMILRYVIATVTASTTVVPKAYTPGIRRIIVKIDVALVYLLLLLLLLLLSRSGGDVDNRSNGAKRTLPYFIRGIRMKIIIDMHLEYIYTVSIRYFALQSSVCLLHDIWFHNDNVSDNTIWLFSPLILDVVVSCSDNNGHETWLLYSNPNKPPTVHTMMAKDRCCYCGCCCVIYMTATQWQPWQRERQYNSIILSHHTWCCCVLWQTTDAKLGCSIATTTNNLYSIYGTYSDDEKSIFLLLLLLLLCHIHDSYEMITMTT